MKDIVERLREPQSNSPIGDPLSLLREAADEIEKLRCLCQHWEIKYARIKVDYIDLVESGKLRPHVRDAISTEH